MVLATEERDERKLFTYPERKAALMRSKGRCACCGKKLTTKTMTMDHIIPLLRGGKNEPENLVALCEACNKQKGNMLYLPYGFYTAITNSAEINVMEKYVEKWFQNVKDQFDLQKFPLIAPVTNVMILPYQQKQSKKDVAYNKQLVYRWSIVGRDAYDEIEAVTELNIREIRSCFLEYREDVQDDRKPPVALYSFRKLTNDKIIAVIAVRVEPEIHHMTIAFPWCISTKNHAPLVLASFINMLLSSVEKIAGLDIYDYLLISKVPNAANCFCMPNLIRDNKIEMIAPEEYVNDKTNEWELDKLNVIRYSSEVTRNALRESWKAEHAGKS